MFFGRFVAGICSFDTILDMVPMGWLQKKEPETSQRQVFGGFFDGFCGFGMILIWF